MKENKLMFAIKKVSHKGIYKSLLDNRVVPPRSLGKIGELAIFLAQIQATKRPKIVQPQMLLFIADHGLTRASEQHGPRVSAYPSSITAQMLRIFLQGKGTVNLLCQEFLVGLSVVNAGVYLSPEIADWLSKFAQENVGVDKKKDKKKSWAIRYLDRSVSRGTGNCRVDNAMTMEQLEQCFLTSRRIVSDLRIEKCNTLLLGEMGIGNSATASLLQALSMDIPLEQCVGPGAGLSTSGVQEKKRALQACIRRWHQYQAGEKGSHCGNQKKSPSDVQLEKKRKLPSLVLLPPEKRQTKIMELLSFCGGFEISMMTAAYLQGAQEGMILLVDGYIASVAYLMSWFIDPLVSEYAVFSHSSAEPGHRLICDIVGKKPLLDLDLFLGEGSGALLALPMLRSACCLIGGLGQFSDLDM